MIRIAHRGLLDGPDPVLENSPLQIDRALTRGLHCEVDVWRIGNEWYTGHDGPMHLVSDEFLSRPELWLHCKNVEALAKAPTVAENYFWHQDDHYTLTSTGLVWTYPGFRMLGNRFIMVLPERNWAFPAKSAAEELAGIEKQDIYGCCTDYWGFTFL